MKRGFIFSIKSNDSSGCSNDLGKVLIDLGLPSRKVNTVLALVYLVMMEVSPLMNAKLERC